MRTSDQSDSDDVTVSGICCQILRVQLCNARFKDDVNDSETDLKVVPFYTIGKGVSLMVLLKVEYRSSKSSVDAILEYLIIRLRGKIKKACYYMK